MRGTGLNDKDRLVLAAFVLGVHIRGDLDSKEISKHSPFEIAEIANTKLPRDRHCHLEENDVLEVLQRLLRLLD